MFLDIYNRHQQLLSVINAYPLCGVDFCANCEECLVCSENKECDHVWNVVLKPEQTLSNLISEYDDRLVDTTPGS
jgi:hypothetical protein